MYELINLVANATTNIGVVWLLFLTTLTAHELGHYLGARLVRLPATRVTVGVGPPLLWTVLPDGVGFRLSLYPTSGSVTLLKGANPSRVKVVLYVVLGPLTELALVAAPTYLLYDQVIGVLLAISALLNFLPTRSPPGAPLRDGRVLLLCWRSYRRGPRSGSRSRGVREELDAI